MKNGRKTMLLVAVGFLFSAPLWAHHGNAAYDNAGIIDLKGTVTEWVWANPHCWLKFDVKDDKGNIVHWIAEDSAPASIINLGFTRHSFKPGDEVTVTLLKAKGGQPVGRVRKVLLPDGSILSEGQGEAVTPGSASNTQPPVNPKP